MKKLAGFLTAVVSTFTLVAIATVGLHVAGKKPHEADAATAEAQTMNTGTRSKGHVEFIADAQTIPANRPATIVLHFRVDPNFHINSHTPKSDMLIPTKILVEDLDGANVTDVGFPQGTPYSFAFEPKTKLDVYTGDVTLTAHIKAKPGNYTLKAALHYQACDQAACYPPKTLPVEQPFTVR